MTVAQNWGSWTRWTPTLTASTTNPSLGTGATARGGYIQTGTLVNFWVQFTLGTGATAGEGFYQFDFPVTPVAMARSIGTGFAVDSSESSKAYPLVVMVSPLFGDALSTSQINPFMLSIETSGTIPEISVGAGVPFTWAAGDEINVNGCYEAATS